MLKSGERYEFIVKSDEVEKRLDVFLTEQFPDYSRSFFKDIIEQSAVTVNGKCATKAGTSLKENAVVIMTIPTPPVKEAISTEVAQTLGVSLVHQEDDFAIIEKPAGIVVHPPKKHSTDLSLLDWLGNTFQNIQDVGYADIYGNYNSGW